MGGKTIKTTEKSSGTTTPQMLPEVQAAVSNYYPMISQFGQAIGNGAAGQYLPQTNSNLQQAFGMGGQLMNRSDALPDAMGYAKQAIGMAGQPDARAPNAPTVSRAYAPNSPQLADLGDGSEYNVNPAVIDELMQSDAALGSDYMGNYLDPMMDDVVAAALADLDFEAGKQRAAMDSEALMNKGFGGSGYHIGRAELLANQARNRGGLSGQLRSDAFKTAIGAGLSDAGNVTQTRVANSANQAQRALAQAQLNQQAGMRNSEIGANFDLARFDAGNVLNNLIYGTNAGLNQFNAGQENSMASQVYGTQADMNQFNANKRLQENQQRLAGAGMLGELGSMDTNDTLARLSGLLNIGQSQYGIDAANSPLALLQAYGGLLNPSGVMNVTTGQNVTGESSGTQKQSGGLLGQILSAAAQVGSAAAMSERRVKRDIVKLGEEADGLGVYRFNYLWDAPDEPARFGVMVDEVERIRPWALGPEIDGVMTVNYGAL